MSEEKCAACRYFMQHYCLKSGRLFRVYFGHCTFLHAKSKRPDAKACEHFTPGVPDTDQFVTKEYLSKELLHYVLSLPLLPGIDDGPPPTL